MKKYFYIMMLVLGLSGSMLAAAPAAFAETAPGFEFCEGDRAATTSVCRDIKTQEGSDSNPVLNTLKIALNVLAFIAGAAAVILLIVNGLRLILSNGDSNGVSSARSGLIYVLVGLAVVVLARVIVVFLLDNI